MNTTTAQLRASADQRIAAMRETFKHMNPVTLNVIRQNIDLLTDYSRNPNDKLIFVLAALMFDDLLCEVEV